MSEKLVCGKCGHLCYSIMTFFLLFFILLLSIICCIAISLYFFPQKKEKLVVETDDFKLLREEDRELLTACKSGTVIELTDAIECGANPQVQDHGGRSGFHLLCMR
jgi:hypothetical protein